MNNNLTDDRLREECGVFGVLGHPDSAQLTVLGLHALQHRGQEAVGIVTFDGTKFQSEKDLGLLEITLQSSPLLKNYLVFRLLATSGTQLEGRQS